MSTLRTTLAAWLSLACLFLCQPSRTHAQVDAFRYSIQKHATGSQGAVASAHPLASRVGLEVLKSGGNAVDAAIAVQLALAVVYPGAGNLGGGGFLVAQMSDGRSLAIDYREKAPGRAHRDMYLDSAGNANTSLSQHAHLAGGVPGTVAGLFASHRHARLPFKELIAPAIALAELGFAVTAAEASSLNGHRSSFLKYSTRPTALVKPSPWQAGDTLRQPELAATLRRIRDQGAKGFYEGETARLIVEEMQRGNGLITYEDLKAYEASVRKAVAFAYRGYGIVSMPLPSSGGLILQQCLGMLEKYDLRSMGFHTPASVQLITETERRAYADRAEFLGDTDFVKVPVKTLVSADYLATRMKDYQPNKAGSSQRTKPGNIRPESEETTHLSVADRWGNVVAVTTTLNGGYGSHTVIGGAGFLLNNEMDDFSVKPGVPNMYGALGTEANAIAPGKRMLSSMTPTIVLKEGKPFLVVGTPGGTTIPTSVLQTIVNILDFDLGTKDAVDKPKFHHQWQPDVVAVEATFPEAVTKELQAMGYTITKRGQIGRTEVIRIERDKQRTLKLEAVADARGDDHAEAY
ncbi:MAG: gamma-glutamyltransferase [Bacteroidetes bacterium]|nr:gamma-glutamyltransferase [Bacteroidota bacterium]